MTPEEIRGFYNLLAISLPKIDYFIPLKVYNIIKEKQTTQNTGGNYNDNRLSDLS